MMTVKELTAKLSQYPGEWLVGFEGDVLDKFFSINGVQHVAVDEDSFHYVPYEGSEPGDVLCVELTMGPVIRGKQR